MNNRPLEQVAAEIKKRVRAEGKTPVIIADDLHDADSYALQFGWAAFWALDDQERARVVATMQLEREIEFVSSHWAQYGDPSPAAGKELAEKETKPADDWLKDW